MRDAPNKPPRQVNGVVGLSDSRRWPPPASGQQRSSVRDAGSGPVPDSVHADSLW
jgi:hypothetical protein